MNKEVIFTEKAPKAIGPYSQGMKIGNMIFTSGQLAINPETGELVNDTIEKETIVALQNLEAVLQKAGSSLDNVIKTTVFIKNMNQFGEINKIYGEFFKDNKPARSCVEVAKLPKNGNVEIEAIAII